MRILDALGLTSQDIRDWLMDKLIDDQGSGVGSEVRGLSQKGDNHEAVNCAHGITVGGHIGVCYCWVG